jgi:hypothetical protein
MNHKKPKENAALRDQWCLALHGARLSDGGSERHDDGNGWDGGQTV